jgi:hypothetical protein
MTIEHRCEVLASDDGSSQQSRDCSRRRLPECTEEPTSPFK